MAKAHSFEKVLDIPPSQNSSLRAATDLRVELLTSSSSGLKVLFSSSLQSTPLFNLIIVVPTRATDHSGLPHTLEHLVFLGSDGHPDKGFLDKLATCGVANGTNAYTSEDHTCYTLCTASPEGLCSIAPVFLDHVLRPLLRDADFAGEVFHSNSGVVYSEMRAREWSEADQMDNLLRNGLYSVSDDAAFEPYRWECGGRTPVIRQLTMDHIRAYHAHWYRPERITVEVSGPLTEALCDRILCSFDTVAYRTQRPLLPPLEIDRSELHEFVRQEGCVTTAEFPADDESVGSVGFTWSVRREHGGLLLLHAWSILGKYLRDNSTSPLSFHFTQRPECVLATSVDWDVRPWGCVQLIFSGVPVEKLPTIGAELEGFVRDHVIQMDLIQDALHANTLALRERFEEDPHEVCLGHLLPEAVCNNVVGLAWTEVPRIYADLATKDASFWTALLRSLCQLAEVRLLPSRRLSAALEKIGEAGDKPGASSVAAATTFDLPAIKASSELVSRALANKLRSVCVSSSKQLVSLQEGASFDYVTIGIDMADIEEALLPYFPTFQEMHFETDVRLGELPCFSTKSFFTRQRDGLVQFAELQAALTRSLVSWGAGMGLESSSSSPFVVGFHETCFVAWAAFPRGELSPEAVLNLLLHVLLGSVFSEERISIALEQLDTALIDGRRDPSTLMDSILNYALFDHSEAESKRSRRSMNAMQAFSLFAQEPFLQQRRGDIAERCAAIQAVLRERLAQGRFFLQLTSDVEAETAGGQFDVQGLPRLARHVVGSFGALVPVRDLTACYLSVTVPVPALCADVSEESVLEFLHIAVVCQLLSMLEGPLYRGIRGAGFAYDASCHISLWNGLLTFSVTEGSDIASAFTVLRETLGNSAAWLTDQNWDLGRKCQLFQMVSERASTAGILSCRLREALLGFGDDFYRLIDGVTVGGAEAVIKKHFSKLLDQQARIVIALCPDSSPEDSDCDEAGADSHEELVRRLESVGLTTDVWHLDDFSTPSS